MQTARPAFESDDEAVSHVIRLAKKGDPEAVDALWAAYADPLVHNHLWGCRHLVAPAYAVNRHVPAGE